MMYTHKQINKWLKDAADEVSNIDSCTKWVEIGNGWWNIRDGDDKLIGWVEASICCNTGKTVFKYRPERTYFNMSGRVDPLVIQSDQLTDSQELQKLVDFDAKIIEVYGLSHHDTQYTPDGDVHGGEDDPRPVAGSPP